MEEHHLQTLSEHDYFVSRKGTGLRSFLYLLVTPEGPAAFLVFTFYAVYHSKSDILQSNALSAAKQCEHVP
jgi:predicted glycosyltransferase involved in capsule biosynthesis